MSAKLSVRDKLLFTRGCKAKTLDSPCFSLYDSRAVEKFVERSLLYDFYGDLLNDHQKNIYEAYVLENLSYGEIAEELGITRQAAFDVIKRCNAALEGYEEKLKLVEKFLLIKEKVERIEASESLEEAKSISADILESL